MDQRFEQTLCKSISKWAVSYEEMLISLLNRKMQIKITLKSDTTTHTSE